MRYIKRHIHFVLVLLQVGLLTSAFFLLFGWVSAVLFILGEVSVAEILDYLIVMSSMEGFGLFVFFEGLAWVVLKKNRKARK